MNSSDKINSKFSIMSGVYWSRPILDVIPEFAAAGFQTIEIWGHPAHFDFNNQTVVELLINSLKAYQIKISAFHICSKEPYAFDSTDINANSNAVENICGLAVLMKQLNTDKLVIHPGNEITNIHFQQRNTALENLRIIAEYYKKAGLYIALENPLPHHLGGLFEDFVFFMDNLKYENVGWCFDTSHAFLSSKLESFFGVCKNRIIHTHLSDNYGKYDDHLIPGEGIIDFKNIFEFLLSDSYSGYINFEVLNSNSADFKNGLNLPETLRKYIMQIK